VESKERKGWELAYPRLLTTRLSLQLVTCTELRSIHRDHLTRFLYRLKKLDYGKRLMPRVSSWGLGPQK